MIEPVDRATPVEDVPVAAHLVEDLVDEAFVAESLAEDVTPRTLRRLFLAALAGRYDYPVRVKVRGYVIGRRDADGPCLEVVPEGLTREAFDLVGPLLVPSARALEEGSVLTAEVDLLDPTGYVMEPPGLLSRAVGVRVDLAIEP